jgi:hypothetical protein
MQNMLQHTIAAVCFAVGLLLAPAALARDPPGCGPPGAPPQGQDVSEPCPPTTRERAPKPSTRVWRPVVRAVKRPLPAPAEHPAPDGPERWYGWQVAVADALSVGLIAAGLAVAGSADESDSAIARTGVVLSSLGFVAYLGGAPVLHGVHERPALRALGSLGLRVGLPLVGVGLGTALANCGSSNDDSFGEGFCEVVGGGLGLVIGMVTAMVMDAALSFEPIEPVTTGVALAPVLRVEHGRAIGGVSGRF